VHGLARPDGLSPDSASTMAPLEQTDADFGTWVHRRETVEESICAAQLAEWFAMLDHGGAPPADGDPLPPLAHWIYAHRPVRASELGGDGHRRRGELLPPLAEAHRMWAGSRVEVRMPLRVGGHLRRETEVVAIERKQGASGPFVRVRLRHEYAQNGEVALLEDQTLIYRSGRLPDHGAREAPARAPFGRERTVSVDPVLLFRYSALTHNAHRIHYDRPYACDVEGYPGLVVHGPLVATLLADLLRSDCPDREPAVLEFRALAPAFDGDALVLRCDADRDGARLDATSSRGTAIMSARVSFR